MCGLELAGLELDHHIAAQLQVIEKQVDEEFITPHVQQHLSAHECKAGTQFQQELGDMLDQRMLDGTLAGLAPEAQEIQAVRILQRFSGQVRLWPGQRQLEIRHRLAGALQQAGFDVDVQHVARPTVVKRGAGVGLALRAVLQARQQHQVVAPGQSSNKLLDDCLIRPGLGKGAHVHQVGARKALHVREGRAQVMRQPVDHLRAPALGVLARQDVAANLPVQPDQLAIDHQRGALLGGVDAALQVGQPVGVALRLRAQASGQIGRRRRWCLGLRLAHTPASRAAFFAGALAATTVIFVYRSKSFSSRSVSFLKRRPM